MKTVYFLNIMIGLEHFVIELRDSQNGQDHQNDGQNGQDAQNDEQSTQNPGQDQQNLPFVSDLKKFSF